MKSVTSSGAGHRRGFGYLQHQALAQGGVAFHEALQHLRPALIADGTRRHVDRQADVGKFVQRAQPVLQCQAVHFAADFLVLDHMHEFAGRNHPAGRVQHPDVALIKGDPMRSHRLHDGLIGQHRLIVLHRVGNHIKR